MGLNNMNNEDSMYAARGKRGFTEKRSSICSHISKMINSGEVKIKIYPMCVQVFEDGYNLAWYCDDCIKIYGLPKNGVYVFDAENDFNALSSSLNKYEVSSDLECNPHMDFFDNECKFSVKRKELKNRSSGFIENPVKNNKKITRLPFGVVRKKTE